MGSQGTWLARRPATVSISAIFSLSGVLTRESPESVASAAPYMPQTDSYDQPSCYGHYWPTVDPQAQPYHSDLLRRDGSFETMGTWEVPAATATPSSGKNLPYFETLGK